METYFKRLQTAYKQLVKDAPDKEKLNVKSLLQWLPDDQAVQSFDEITIYFQEKFQREVSAEQIAFLAEIVASAASKGETEPSTEVDVDTIETVGSQVREDTIIPDNVALSATQAKVDDSVPPAPQQAAVESKETSQSTYLDPSPYQIVSPINPGNYPITVELSHDGTMDVSWPGLPNRVYVVACSDKAAPKRPKSEFPVLATEQASVNLGRAAKFITVFEFETGKPKGVIYGTVENLGAIQNLQIQPSTNDVRMQWAPVDNDATVRIARSIANEKLPDVITDGFVINKSMENSATLYIDNKGIHGGEKYEYAIWIEKTAGGIVRKGEPEIHTVTIPGIIPDVVNFTATRSAEDPQKVDISYTLPEGSNAKVLVYEVQGQPSNNLLGEIQNTVRNPRLLTELSEPSLIQVVGSPVISEPVEEEGVTFLKGVPLTSLEVGARTYVALVTLGEHFRISATAVIQHVSDISSADLIDRYDYQLLRVTVPEGADVLGVWITSAGTEWSSVNQENPDRIVDIENEYRNFGGIVFTDGSRALPLSQRLPNDPRRIFVRGASVFNQKYQWSTGYTEVDYLGKIVVHVDVVQAPPPPPAKGLFKKKAAPVQAKAEVRFKISVPTESYVPEITLTKLRGTNNEYPTRVSQTDGVVVLNPADYADWAAYKPSQNTLDTFQNGIKLGAGETFRFLPVRSSFGVTTPIFVVDESVSRRQSQLGEFTPSGRDFKVIIVGPKRSGKTTYVQALLNYLERQLAPLFSSFMTADPSSPAAEYRLEELHNFIRGGLLPDATLSAAGRERPATDVRDPRTPIKFNFEQGNPPFKSIEFYDVAGEDMDKESSIALYDQELLAADLVLFLFDPLQIASIRQALKGSIDLPEPGVNPAVVLSNVGKILTAPGANRNRNQKVAVAISKFDGLITASDAATTSDFKDSISKGMSVTRDPNSWTTKQFNEVDSRQVDREIESLLKLDQQINAFVFGVRNQMAVETRFFAVSALGHATFAREIGSAGITSYRVADPLLWMASSVPQNGIPGQIQNPSA